MIEFDIYDKIKFLLFKNIDVDNMFNHIVMHCSLTTLKKMLEHPNVDTTISMSDRFVKLLEYMIFKLGRFELK